MAQHYSNPKRANDPHALPNIETFEARIMRCPVCEAEYPETNRGGTSYRNTDSETTCCHNIPLVRAESAWWFWYALPGCLPDSDPWGPFATEDEALAVAREDTGEDEDEDEDVRTYPYTEEVQRACTDRNCARHSDFGGDMPHTDAVDEDIPQDEDYYLSSDERSVTYLGRIIAGPVDIDSSPNAQDAVMRELADVIAIDDYAPNVWRIDDHGGHHLISVQACGCYFTEHIGQTCTRNNNA